MFNYLNTLFNNITQTLHNISTGFNFFKQIDLKQVHNIVKIQEDTIYHDAELFVAHQIGSTNNAKAIFNSLSPFKENYSIILEHKKLLEHQLQTIKNSSIIPEPLKSKIESHIESILINFNTKIDNEKNNLYDYNDLHQQYLTTLRTLEKTKNDNIDLFKQVENLVQEQIITKNREETLNKVAKENLTLKKTNRELNTALENLESTLNNTQKTNEYQATRDANV